ncbi:MAG: twin-arginine translocase subunit TatC [Nanoarchaeota archaeon]
MEGKAVLEHLDELRSRLIIIISCLLLFFGIGVSISLIILNKLASDILIPEVTLVSLSPLEILYTQIYIGFILAIALTLPIICYHTIMFIRPGLNKAEIQAIKYILPSFFLLFALGMVFSYNIILEISLAFFAGLGGFSNIQNYWSVYKFISFITLVCTISALIFELPLLILLLNRLKIVDISYLKKKRKYTYLIAFIFAAVITPPDAFTQILIAIPIIILFELSFILIKIIE